MGNTPRDSATFIKETRAPSIITMAGGGIPGDASSGTDTPREKSRATADTLKTGCIAWVEKDGKPRRAEILSIKTTKSGKQFYCNFDSYNKRLDEWVPAARIDFEQDVEWPRPEPEKTKDSKKKTNDKKVPQPSKKRKAPVSKREQSVSKREQSVSEAATPHPWTEFVESQDGRKSASLGPDGEATGRDSIEPSQTPGVVDDTEAEDKDVEGANGHADEFNRKEEIEKLRTSGSMTQNPTEVSRIRNISKVQFGRHELFPWYFSPYPEAFTEEDCVFICEMCLGYYGDQMEFVRHRKKCQLFHPPGNEIYRDDYVSFYEIDGRRQRTWCRNLCLLSKMFLDHKTLYYDVDPFLFYVMTTRTDKGDHVVGYFSKEKESADGYNVACILTLPQYQRKGFGRLLIQFSYELSRIEGKLGSPEKPLSDLGLLSYRQYWSENIIDTLLDYNERGDKITIETISTALAMTTQDVEHTLQVLRMQVYHRGEHKIVLPEKLVRQREVQRQKVRRTIDPERIQWKPPVFAASARTWAW